MAAVMGQGSSCMGDDWRGLAEPPWMLVLDPDPVVCKGETNSSPTITAAQVWRSSAAHRSMECSGNPGKAPSQGHRGPAKPLSLLCHRNQLRLQLRLSLLPAPAANGNGHGRAAARNSDCHAGIVQGVGSHGARALGKGTAARQRPARVTGHCHLPGRRGHHHPWVSKGLPIPHAPAVQGDVAAVTQLDGVSHCRWGQPQWAEANPKPIRVAEGWAETKTTPGQRSMAHPYLLLEFQGHVLLQLALQAGIGAARGVCHHLCPAGTAAGPPPQPHLGPATSTQHHGWGVETAPCPGERGHWHRAATAASQGTHW